MRLLMAIMRSAMFFPSWLSKKCQPFTVMLNCLAIEGVATIVSLGKGEDQLKLIKWKKVNFVSVNSERQPV